MNNFLLYKLFSLPDLKITGNGSGQIHIIEAGGVRYNGNHLIAEEAMIEGLLCLTAEIAKRQASEAFLKVLQGEAPIIPQYG